MRASRSWNDGAQCISLTPYDDEVVVDLLTWSFGAWPDDELLDFARGTGGNAELFTELVLGLKEDRAVQVTGKRALLVSRQLPRRVHRVAQRRIDRFSKPTRNLLITVSVLGSSPVGRRRRDARRNARGVPALGRGGDVRPHPDSGGQRVPVP